VTTTYDFLVSTLVVSILPPNAKAVVGLFCL